MIYNQHLLVNFMEKKSNLVKAFGLTKDKDTNISQDYEWVSEWSTQFTNQIEKPIHMREDFLSRTEPQKCFQHSIIFSIYCTVCRKVLCASCMYSTMAHRKHRIIPIQNAAQEIKEDIQAFEFKIPKVSSIVSGLLNTNNLLLLKLDRDFSHLQTQIQNFYEHLKELFIKKEKDQISHLKQIKDTARQEILIYNRELSRQDTYIKQKFKQYTDQKVKSKILLASRNILEILMHSSSFINENLLSSQKFGYSTSEKRIKDIRDDIELKVNSLVKTFHDKDFNLSKIRTQSKSSKVDYKKDERDRSLSAKNHETHQQFRDSRRKNSSVIGQGRSLKGL